MTINKLNDAPILDQLDGQWQKMFVFLLYKFAKTEKIKITAQDMMECNEVYPGGPVLFTHGHSDSVEVQIIDQEAAARIAEYQKQQETNLGQGTMQ